MRRRRRRRLRWWQISRPTSSRWHLRRLFPRATTIFSAAAPTNATQMNTLELTRALSGLSRKIKMRGVFPADGIPFRLDLPAALIANTQTADMPGMHWVGLFIKKNGLGYFFDSYGCRPDTSYMKDAIKRNCRLWCYNKKPLQSIGSDVCGQYCLQFIYFMAKNGDLQMFLDQFSKNTESNDKKNCSLLPTIEKIFSWKKKITEASREPT